MKPEFNAGEGPSFPDERAETDGDAGGVDPA